jgi:hypothetical protein
MFNETIRQLATITDAAQFERIVTSVLRSANPKLYANISHPGVNTNGKTVKSPLDNVGWVRVHDGGMCVAAAHTTSSKDDLEGKWLHDPHTVKPRKRGKAPTQVAGDLVKAISEIAELRKTHPNLKASLALTCNREEPTGVRVKAETLAHSANIDLDIWSVSRIAQYLDTTPEGQAIRRTYLGTQVELLSKSELLRVGALSLTERVTHENANTLVARTVSFDGTGHALISGASGMGKSTICFGVLRNNLAEGRPGIVLDSQSVREASTIEEAIDIELRRYLPELESLAGRKALDFCSEIEPLIVIVEDINRAENTINLLNKLASWMLQGASADRESSRRKWRLLCPIWPKFVAGLEKAKEITNGGMLHVIGEYSENDALEAVKLRGEALGRPQHDLAAAAVSQALGRDPLLIGLYDFEGPAQRQEVIAQYIHREFESIALLSGFTVTDLETAVEALLTKMLVQRRMSPTWREIQNWLKHNGELAALRALVTKGSVLRLSNVGGQEILEARHDRVLYSLFANFIAITLTQDVSAPYLFDPYYAEFVGTGVSLAQLNRASLQAFMERSPLVLFYAFKHAAEVGSDYAATASRAIGDWIVHEAARTGAFDTRRMLGLQILSEIDSPTVLELTAKFPEIDWHQPFFEARFRNGDLAAALNWLTEYSFSTNVPGRYELIDHVRHKYGSGLVRAVESTLKTQTLEVRALRGALLLAGYLADPLLRDAVRVAWQQTSPEERDLEAFLWAAARTCGDDPATTLGPVLDAWEALPDPEDSHAENPRSSLAAYGISWNFRDHVPRSAIPFFVQRANESEALRWPITYMLRGIDDPIALQHEVEFLAERSRQVAEMGGIVDHFLANEWRRRTGELGKPMSELSKHHLLSLATDLNNDEHLRKRAFLLWEISIHKGDVTVARAIKNGDPLYGTAIWARARRRDMTVMQELLVKLKDNPGYWWQAGRYIWSDELTTALRELIDTLTENPEEKHDALGGWILPELILELDIQTAERLVLAVWPKVRAFRKFVQIALCIATPKLVDLANAAISETAKPQSLFEHFSSTAGFHVGDRAGFTRVAQIEAIKPHLSHLSEMDLIHLGDCCNDRNWREFRKTYVEPILLAKPNRQFGDRWAGDSIDMSELDDELTRRHWPVYHWFEKQQRQGATREHVFQALVEWVQKKRTSQALAVVSEIYSNDATREEYAELEKVATQIVGHEAVLAGTKFNVFNRTLT